ncbi:LytR C-terminal domain-containing protein [Candidatus Nomurabacteria bacterium]|nr:LytR C-terminal domain-containing protein [Candidatus Nomurabacteria bacterium]
MAFILATFVPIGAVAQESLSLSVTPTLFEMSATKGQMWQSNIKVINTNTFPLTVYARPVNFAPRGESGQGKFVPILSDVTEGSTLAEWIQLDPETPYTIEPEQSLTIPFTIDVPEDAAPGGHFAAVLVGTKPPESSDRLEIRTSQIVTSLFFLRIEGDVVEDGRIRSFSVANRFATRPEAEFDLRFENRGNVHIQPQGQITIYNMWGKERGVIPINLQTHFGNVLPDSIRNFQFSWQGEFSVTDIGRYTAKVALAYGNDVRQFSDSEVTFWVVPLKPLLLTLLIVGLIVMFIVWAIRSYVRRMLALAGVAPGTYSRLATADRTRNVSRGDVNLSSYQTISSPIRTGFLDLRTQFHKVDGVVDVAHALSSFIKTYNRFFIAFTVLVTIAVGLFFYIKTVTVDSRSFEVAIENPSQVINLSSEEIILSEKIGESNTLSASTTQPFTITLVNTSGQSGVAAETAVRLASKGYAVQTLSTEAGRIDKRSVIVYDPALTDSALALSSVLGGALPSATTETTTESNPAIVIYLGRDQLSN